MLHLERFHGMISDTFSEKSCMEVISSMIGIDASVQPSLFILWTNTCSMRLKCSHMLRTSQLVSNVHQLCNTISTLSTSTKNCQLKLHLLSVCIQMLKLISVPTSAYNSSRLLLNCSQRTVDQVEKELSPDRTRFKNSLRNSQMNCHLTKTESALKKFWENLLTSVLHTKMCSCKKLST